jgi:hypothetical protein
MTVAVAPTLVMTIVNVLWRQPVEKALQVIDQARFILDSSQGASGTGAEDSHSTVVKFGIGDLAGYLASDIHYLSVSLSAELDAFSDDHLKFLLSYQGIRYYKRALLSFEEGFLLIKMWWAHQDSNLGPTGYEPVALTTELWALVGRAGDETRTRGPLLGRQMLYQLSYSRWLLTECRSGRGDRI